MFFGRRHDFQSPSIIDKAGDRAIGIGYQSLEVAQETFERTMRVSGWGATMGHRLSLSLESIQLRFILSYGRPAFNSIFSPR